MPKLINFLPHFLHFCIKILQKHANTWKKEILTSVWSAQHPTAGRIYTTLGLERKEVSRYKNFQFLEYRPGLAKNKKNFFDLSLDVLLWSYHACQLKIRLGAEGNKLGLVLQCSGRSQFESSASVWPATKKFECFFFFFSSQNTNKRQWESKK